MNNTKILLLEDDANLNETITEFLEELNYDVTTTYDGYEAQDTYMSLSLTYCC